MATSRYCNTQEALARKSGVAQSTIVRILRGEVNPQTSTMTFLAEALGVPFETLAVAAQGEKSVELPVQEPACADDYELVRIASRIFLTFCLTKILTISA